MSDLRDLEQRTFRAARDDGLWDVLAASMLSMMAFGPWLSESMGDFWSSAVFIPVVLGVYVAIHFVRQRVIRPRIGTIELAEERQERLKRAGWVLLIVNIVALALGLLAFVGFEQDWTGFGGSFYPLALGIVLVAGGSFVAYVTGIWRFALYGLLLGVGVMVGEWLWQQGIVGHHGYPIVFGTAVVVMVLAGLARLTVVLRGHRLPDGSATV